MSIQLTIRAAGLNLNATLRDDALVELIKLTQSFRDEQAASLATSKELVNLGEARPMAATATTEDDVKNQLKNLGAAELLNRVKCDNYPDKILLLAAWCETHGGNPGWKSADIDKTFAQAKEQSPANFPRDIKQAIKSGWIHTMTPRSYCVTRSGWNKVADELSK